MIPIIPIPPLSVRQKSAALWVAGTVDFIQMPGFSLFGEGFLSPFQDFLDILTAILLVAICGFRWQFILAFSIELVPGLTLFPTWTMVVLTLPTSLAPAPESPPEHLSDSAPRINVRRVDENPSRPPQYDIIDMQAVIVPPVQAPQIRNIP